MKLRGYAKDGENFMKIGFQEKTFFLGQRAERAVEGGVVEPGVAAGEGGVDAGAARVNRGPERRVRGPAAQDATRSTMMRGRMIRCMRRVVRERSAYASSRGAAICCTCEDANAWRMRRHEALRCRLMRAIAFGNSTFSLSHGAVSANPP